MSPEIIASLLSVLVGAVVGPFVTAAVKKLGIVDAKLGSAINLIATLALYLGAWWVVADGDPAQFDVYVTLALAAAGLGSAANNVYRKRILPRR